MRIDAARDVSVIRFRAVLLTAAEHACAVVSPIELVEPVELWLRGQEERARREDWKSLLSRDINAPWAAAVAILDAAGVGLPED